MSDIIYLLGYMGCGKTTLGRALQARCGVRFIDLDDYIVERAGRTVPQIFASGGEAAFRAMERDALRAIAGSARSGAVTVVACGGGTPCQEGNMELMNSTGRTVWLVTSPERLFSRLAVARAGRPLIAALSDDELRSFIHTQLAARTPHYSLATDTFDSTWLEDEDQINATVIRFSSQYL